MVTPGCGSVWLERLVWDQEVAGSNPVTPIITYARVAQLVEHDLAKVGVAGSSPVSRSHFLLNLLGFPDGEPAFSVYIKEIRGSFSGKFFLYMPYSDAAFFSCT